MPEQQTESPESSDKLNSQESLENEDRQTTWDKYLSSEPIKPDGSVISDSTVESEESSVENKQSLWDKFLRSPPDEQIVQREKPLPYTIPASKSKATQPVSCLPESFADEILKKIDGIYKEINNLRDEFNKKLKYDAHKESLIDKLYQELQGYKDDYAKKYLKTVMLDIIKVIDNIKKLSAYYSSQDPSQIDIAKLIELLHNIPSDLEDVFYWQNVKTYTSSSPTFDPTRQRILKTVITSDKSKDKLVAESIRPGYEWDGQVIRPEMVAVYTYKELPDQKEEIRSSDE